jgi:uncharacterized protein YndB with AHSA1/START domain
MRMYNVEMTEQITVETSINASREAVWDIFNDPKHIVKWNNASPDWHSPRAENDLRVGGTFNTRMEAKDGSQGFDFTGIYDEVVPLEKIAYTMSGADARKATVTFGDMGNNTHVIVSFDPENENPIEMQRAGWQAILDNLKAYVESLA